MDRVRWCSDDFQRKVGVGPAEESVVVQQNGVCLYDGGKRIGFDNGLLSLTTHRLLWVARPNSGESFIALPLVAVLNATMEAGGGGFLRNRTPKIVLHLLTQPALETALLALPHTLPWIDRWRKNTGGDAYAVVSSSSEDHIKLGFAAGGEKHFWTALEETLKAKPWAVTVASARIHGGPGIAGIERQQAARAHATDARLEGAFEDLNKLISQAKEMVTLSHTLAHHTREAKGGELTNDETAELRATMLSMGVEDDEERSGTARTSLTVGFGSFHTQLAHQISNLLTPILSEMENGPRSKYRHMGAGCIDLASAYCRINRALGMQLVSPEDVLKACSLLERERLPLRMKKFPSGLLVLHLASENEEQTLQATMKLVEDRSNLTAAELARAVSLSPLLARERLLALEELGLVCRDDTEAGLRFYPNLFLTRT